MSAVQLSTDVVLDGLAFPETPRWRAGRLYFSDMDDHRVMWVDPATGRAEVVAEVASRPSGLGWLPDGTLLVVSMHDLAVLRVERGGLAVHSDLSRLARYHANDMCVLPSGRAYVGSFGFNPRAGVPDELIALICVEPDGSARFTGEPLHFPNGIAVSADGRTLVVAESRGHRLTAFTIAADGSLTDRRLYADLGGAFPDGICIDAEGAVWAALIFENAVARFEPGGRMTHRVPTGELRAYACMLGGADGHTLFVCAAATSEPGDAARLRTGTISAARVSVPAAGWP